MQRLEVSGVVQHIYIYICVCACVYAHKHTHTHSHPPYLEVISSFHNFRVCHAMVLG
jgi:hypothetical protein